MRKTEKWRKKNRYRTGL